MKWRYADFIDMCLLRRITEWKVKGMERRSSRRKHLLDDLKVNWRYCYLKGETLDRILWRTYFGRRYELRARQTTLCVCVCLCIYIYIVLVCILSLVCSRSTVDRSWQSAPNVVATLQDRVRFDSRWGQNFCLTSPLPNRLRGLPPVHWVPADFYPGRRVLRHAADPSLSSSAEVNNARSWTYTSTCSNSMPWYRTLVLFCGNSVESMTTVWQKGFNSQ